MNQSTSMEEIKNKVENIDLNVDAVEKIEEEEEVSNQPTNHEKDDNQLPTEVKVKREENPVVVDIPSIPSQCEKDEYLIKTIDWKDKKIQIITQNGKKIYVIFWTV
jgi:hypothetical protein